MRTATPERIEIAFSGRLASFAIDAQFSERAKGVAAISSTARMTRRCLCAKAQLWNGRVRPGQGSSHWFTTSER